MRKQNKIEWNKVTWYSKWASLLFFILVLPVLTFCIGMKYQEVQDLTARIDAKYTR
ncbi:MAG TPA: hypothetical protein VK145_03340 [Candidatus Nanoarchaeia archaeon]|nr:hypothetical protein [Candidatus Nanoarchaeia archaeon]